MSSVVLAVMSALFLFVAFAYQQTQWVHAMDLAGAVLYALLSIREAIKERN